MTRHSTPARFFVRGLFIFLIVVMVVVQAFTSGSTRLAPHRSQSTHRPRRIMAMGMSAPGEWDDFLHESSSATTTGSVHSRRRIVLGNEYQKGRTTVLTSSTVVSPFTKEQFKQQQQQQQQTDGEQEQGTEEESDPFALDEGSSSALQKVEQYERQQQTQPSIESKLKSMDLQDIIVTFILPSIAVFAAGRWGYNRVAGRVSESKQSILNSFAKEMLYHDGNFKEMELCVKEYSKKLLWLPTRKDAMVKAYLEQYAKRKTISPQAIASLSYAFSLFQLSEPKAAQTLVALCHDMGTDKISSAGKLLFLGSRILKSPEGQEALRPIKVLIKSTYRDEKVAETLVETSQHAIAEAAYRSAVLAAGKNQPNLTQGWQVLGLDQATATRIFNEEAKEGFVSDRETMYGGQTRKYDAKGFELNQDGSYANPEEAKQAAKEEETTPVSNVQECANCGYTLFIAEGRESKFFGDDFRCPECGAPKDKFRPPEDDDEE